ncbi:MAG: hypothetical protein ACI9MR_004266 [Myxococcota bacterium]|jgi:hypothetical protein
MNRVFSKLSGLALVAVFALGAVATQAQAKSVTPAIGSAEATILQGLKLINAGKFDKWVSTQCSKEKLCHNTNAIKSVKKYNLPALKRIASQCIKAGDTLDVTKVQGDAKTDATLKIFVQCNPKGMPRPFHLIKNSKGAWKFSKI